MLDKEKYRNLFNSNDLDKIIDVLKEDYIKLFKRLLEINNVPYENSSDFYSFYNLVYIALPAIITDLEIINYSLNDIDETQLDTIETLIKMYSKIENLYL